MTVDSHGVSIITPWNILLLMVAAPSMTTFTTKGNISDCGRLPLKTDPNEIHWAFAPRTGHPS